MIAPELAEESRGHDLGFVHGLGSFAVRCDEQRVVRACGVVMNSRQ
jgi:hypothetical protein